MRRGWDVEMLTLFVTYFSRIRPMVMDQIGDLLLGPYQASPPNVWSKGYLVGGMHKQKVWKFLEGFTHQVMSWNLFKSWLVTSSVSSSTVSILKPFLSSHTSFPCQPSFSECYFHAKLDISCGINCFNGMFLVCFSSRLVGRSWTGLSWSHSQWIFNKVN